MSDITYLNKDNYSEFTAKDGVIVVDFYADWCGPCKMMTPVFEEAAADYKDRAVIAKINVDENRELAAQHKVMGIPTMLFYKDGEIVNRMTGAVDKESLYSKIDSLL